MGEEGEGGVEIGAGEGAGGVERDGWWVIRCGRVELRRWGPELGGECGGGESVEGFDCGRGRHCGCG